MLYDVYISPANHHKRYANGATEKEQMEKLAPLIKGMLENRYVGVVVHLPTVFNKNQQYTGRPLEAQQKGCNVYTALHTNAGGNKSTGGTAKGACAFYDSTNAQSVELATAIVTELNAICPIKSNRAKKPAVYRWQVMNIGEVREAAKRGMCAVLIEHEFHDRLEGAEWICNNLEKIAEADVRAIAKVLGLRKRGDVNNDGYVDNTDALQILKHDAGLTELTESQKTAADYNNDGVVDNTDAVQILKHDAGVLEVTK